MSIERLNNVFAYPWVLSLVVLLVPVIWWSWLRRGQRATLRFSSLARIRKAPVSWSLKARHVIPTLRSIAVILLVLSIARPRRADEMTRVQTEGVALELVVDRSGSMREKDFVNSEGRVQTRLAAVKEVVHDFVLGDGRELKGREGDLIGMTVFARFPDTTCPLTRDHRHLLRSLEKVRVPREGQFEDGTAIGDALLLAVERIRNIGRRFENREDFKITSRAIILLTDGEQNAGQHPPTDAAEAASALGIKVYTIGAAPMFTKQRLGFFGVTKRRVPVDEETLREVAERTGGAYFRATDSDSLAGIYKKIDEMERSKVDEISYYLYEELAYRWIQLGKISIPPPLLVALLLVGIEVLLANTRFRSVP